MGQLPFEVENTEPAESAYGPDNCGEQGQTSEIEGTISLERSRKDHGPEWNLRIRI